MRKRSRRISFFKKEEDSDPLSVVVNLFDVAMVFAVSLMVAMVMHMNMTEVFTDKDFTIVKNPGKENMEIITKNFCQVIKYFLIFDESSSCLPKCEVSRLLGKIVCPKSSRANNIWQTILVQSLNSSDKSVPPEQLRCLKNRKMLFIGVKGMIFVR